MKVAIKFILVYSLVSILILVLSQVAFHPFSVEIFSYAIWLYIFYTVTGVIVFLLFGFLSSKYILSISTRVIYYAILCLFVLNSIPLIGENKFLTFDAIKGLLAQKAEFIEVGVHIIAIASFVISYLFVFRRNKISHF